MPKLDTQEIYIRSLKSLGAVVIEIAINPEYNNRHLHIGNTPKHLIYALNEDGNVVKDGETNFCHTEGIYI